MKTLRKLFLQFFFGCAKCDEVRICVIKWLPKTSSSAERNIKFQRSLFRSLQGINVSHTLPEEKWRTKWRKKRKSWKATKNKSQFMTHISSHSLRRRLRFGQIEIFLKAHHHHRCCLSQRKCHKVLFLSLNPQKYDFALHRGGQGRRIILERKSLFVVSNNLSTRLRAKLHLMTMWTMSVILK